MSDMWWGLGVGFKISSTRHGMGGLAGELHPPDGMVDEGVFFSFPRDFFFTSGSKRKRKSNIPTWCANEFQVQGSDISGGGACVPARSVCLVTLSLSEAGPGRFGGQASVTDIYHAMPCL